MPEFRPGDRVQMTEAALHAGFAGPRRRRTGTVMSVARLNLWVWRDGDRRAYPYRPQFWRHLSAPTPHEHALSLAAHLEDDQHD